MITDAMLKMATDELDAALLAGLTDAGEDTHKFSDRFERKMKKVIYRANHPFLTSLGCRIAVAVLALLLVGGTVLLVSPGAKAALTGWIKEVYGNGYHYFLPDGVNGDAPASYVLEWVPDEYAFKEKLEMPNSTAFVYYNSEGSILQFSYYFGAKNTNSDLFIVTEGYVCKKIFVGKQQADLYVNENSTKCALLWSDEGGKVLFFVSAQVEPEILVKIAESVVVEEK